MKVWEKSHQLTLEVYKITKMFPRDERFGLTSQTRRASASIPANIAEGCGRRGAKEFARFLQIAMGRRVSWNIIFYSHEILTS